MLNDSFKFFVSDGPIFLLFHFFSPKIRTHAREVNNNNKKRYKTLSTFVCSKFAHYFIIFKGNLFSCVCNLKLRVAYILKENYVFSVLIFLHFLKIVLYFFLELKALSNSQLNEIYLELERMIQENSEVLIQELALRDELEYEKELKNTFISYLLTIQNKKRQHSTEKRRGRSSTGNSMEAKVSLFITDLCNSLIEKALCFTF